MSRVLVPNVALAQALPTSQPNMITIVREEVKLGRDADHAKVEAGWPAAYAKANSPDYYLAMTSMTGAPEAWYITAYASHAAIGDSLKREDSDAVLTAELARLRRADADVISSVRTRRQAKRMAQRPNALASMPPTVYMRSSQAFPDRPTWSSRRSRAMANSISR